MIARTAQLTIVVVATLTVSCDHSTVRQATGPEATVSSTSSVVGRVVLTADAAPGNAVATNACLSFHAKVYDRSTPEVYLPNQEVDWWTASQPLRFDNAGTYAPTEVFRPSSQAVLVCGKFDGFGKFNVFADGVPADKSPWSIDVGSPVQTLSIYGPSSMQNNQSSVQLQAWAVDQFDMGKDLTTMAVWNSSDPTVISLSLDAGQEWATQHRIGSVTITAKVYGKTATLLINVLGIASVDVTPKDQSVDKGKTLQLTATPRDANGNPFTGKTIAWKTSDSFVAQVSSSGLVTANYQGQAQITATADGVPGSTSVTVLTNQISGYYVTSLSGAPTPITSAGTYYLTPTTSVQGTPPVTYQWDISYSNNVLPHRVTNFQSGDFPLNAPDGSYTITVTVTPRESGLTPQQPGAPGYPSTFKYPVCTGGATIAQQPVSRGGMKRPNSDGGVIQRVTSGCGKQQPV